MVVVTSLYRKNEINWRHDTKGNVIDRDRMNHPVIHVSWNDGYWVLLCANRDKRNPVSRDGYSDFRCAQDVR